jgi:6-phosphofructokinase 1
MIFASTIDLDEAYRVGQKAAHLAAAGEGGFMATLLREPGPIYNVRYDKVPLETVANSERAFPAAWIAASGTDVTDDFVRYAEPLLGNEWPAVPLIGGRVRMTRFEPIFAGQKLPKYIPQADRVKA